MRRWPGSTRHWPAPPRTIGAPARTPSSVRCEPDDGAAPPAPHLDRPWRRVHRRTGPDDGAPAAAPRGPHPALHPECRPRRGTRRRGNPRPARRRRGTAGLSRRDPPCARRRPARRRGHHRPALRPQRLPGPRPVAVPGRRHGPAGSGHPAAAGAVTASNGYLYDGEVVCYTPQGGQGGLYAGSEDGRTVVLGSTEILSNGALAEEGNAALVLRSLGAEPRLVWYLPGISDVPAAKQPVTLAELAAPWTHVLGPWLAFVAVLAIFWRGRRLGPLVFEPLPVVVKAVETAEGRARLYHDARAVDRATEVLRAGTLVRLARILRLGPDAGAAAIIDAAGRHLGRTPEEIGSVLNATPRAEAELVRWAQQLDRLEKEVHAR